jgi:hypothetical protein
MVLRLNEEKTNFDEAVMKFGDFLKANRFPREIVWVQPEDVLLTGKRLVHVRVYSQETREKMARKTYEEGMPRRLGVLLGTICEMGSTTCSFVWAPESKDEAARALMPVGLKLRASLDKIRGIPVKSGLWWMYLKYRHRRKQGLREELFR